MITDPKALPFRCHSITTIPAADGQPEKFEIRFSSRVVYTAFFQDKTKTYVYYKRGAAKNTPAKRYADYWNPTRALTWIPDNYRGFETVHKVAREPWDRYTVSQSGDSCAYDTMTFHAPPNLAKKRRLTIYEKMDAIFFPTERPNGPSEDEKVQLVRNKMQRVTVAHCREDEKHILPFLKKVGFEVVAEQKSRHKGSYPVYLIVYDPKKNNNNKDLDAKAVKSV